MEGLRSGNRGAEFNHLRHQRHEEREEARAEIAEDAENTKIQGWEANGQGMWQRALAHPLPVPIFSD